MESLGLARPYAKAIFSVAAVDENFDKWYKNLQILVYLMQHQVVLQYVKSPHFTALQKADKLIELSAGEFCSKFQRMVHMLAAANRLLLIANIYDAFVSLLRKHRNILYARIRTAYPLSSKQQEKISQQLLVVFKQKQVEIHQTVDSSLLGGVVIQVDDLELDYSVRGRIAKIRNQIVS